MAFWTKKKKTKSIEPSFIPPPQHPVITPKCQHNYKDFPWYITATYNELSVDPNYNSFTWRVIEPYVCIYCKERKNKELDGGTRAGLTRNEAYKLLDRICDKYKDYLKPQAIVEDMINDFQLVDRQALYFYEQLNSPPKNTDFCTPSSIRKNTPAEKVELH